MELHCGGLTPPADLIREAVNASPVPVMVLIRARPGGFVFSQDEIDLMERQVRESRAAGAAGLVVGSLTGDGRIHKDHVRRLVDAADGLPVTFHRGIDETVDVLGAADRCRQLGIARVLTSGGAATAQEGSEALAAMVRAGGPTVLAAGGIRAGHVEQLVTSTGVKEIHARASAIPELLRVLRAE